MNFKSWLFLVGVTIVVSTSLFAEDSLEILQLEELPLEALPLETLPLEDLPLETLPLEALPLESLPSESLPVDTLDTLVQEESDTSANEDLAEELEEPVDTAGQKSENLELKEFSPLPAKDTVDEREFIKKVIDFKEEAEAKPQIEKKPKKSGYYASFLENPASIARRETSYFSIPLGFTLSYREDELAWEDFIKMYEENEFVSQMEDDLSANNWDIFLAFKKSLLSVGYENFQINSDFILEAEIKDLGVQWLKFLLAEKDKDKEMLLADQKGEGTQVLAYVKNSLAYAVPNSFVFGKTSLNFGLNLNIYNSIGYAKIDKLSQRVGATPEESSVECEYTRSKFNGASTNSSMGLGLGVMVDGLPSLLFLDEGRAYLSVDDLFAKLTFSDVEKVQLSRVVSKKDGQLDTVDVETTYELEDLNVTLDPEYSVGISYNIFREALFGSMYLVSKYRKAVVAYDQGFSVGADYFPFECLPIELRYGVDEDPYFSAAIALDLKWQLGVRYVSYGSDPTKASKGFTVGLDFLRIKF